MKYRSTNAGPGERVVHNFPADGRAYGVEGFRYWTEPTERAEGAERVRCHCDWTEKVPEHYGTVAVVTEDGERHSLRATPTRPS